MADGSVQAAMDGEMRLLEPGVRAANSAWSFVDAEAQQRFERDLRRSLADGTWDARYGSLRTKPSADVALRLVIGRP